MQTQKTKSEIAQDLPPCAEVPKNGTDGIRPPLKGGQGKPKFIARLFCKPPIKGGQKPISSLVAMVALFLAIGACTCGPLNTARNVQGTAVAVKGTADSSIATVQAVATVVGQYLPTLRAGATQYGPSLEATLTAVAADSEAAGVSMPALPVSIGSLLSGESIYDGGDRLETTSILPIDKGYAAAGDIPNNFHAQNWLYVASVNETITITVRALGGGDPYLKVIGPGGNIIAEDDDSGGGLDAQISLTMSIPGVYTLRVTSIVPGGYTVVVE